MRPGAGQSAWRNFRGAADIGLDVDTLKALKGRHQALGMVVAPQTGLDYGGVAQLVRAANHNPRVGGSSPSSATISFNGSLRLKKDLEAFSTPCLTQFWCGLSVVPDYIGRFVNLCVRSCVIMDGTVKLIIKMRRLIINVVRSIIFSSKQ